MEVLYSKLHDKYTKLKERKDSEMEQFNREQETRFMKYVSAAEDLIEHLRNENKSLHAKINNLTDEMASNRSAKECEYAEYQKLLIKQNQRVNDLSEEVERFRELVPQKLSDSTKNGTNENEQLKSPSTSSQIGSRELSKGSSGWKAPKACTRQSEVLIEEAGVISYARCHEEYVVVNEQTSDLYEGTPSNDHLKNIQQTNCCRGNTASSGEGVNGTGHVNCLFQTLVESLVGMKFSIANQTEGLCLSVLHDSSGYSFSLTWIGNLVGEEAELLYRVLSLGTLERIAPEWMREDLMFSMSMCAIFFKRVSKIIMLHN